MLAAILSTDDPKGFRTAMIELVTKAAELPTGPPSHEVANDEQRLPQVHALNCLKDIMTNSRFRTVSEQYVNTMLRLAASSLNTSIWAIRNCGLMLLRACINRIDTILPGASPDQNSTQITPTAAETPFSIAISLLSGRQVTLNRSSCVQQPSFEHDTQRQSSDMVDPEQAFAALDLLARIHVQGSLPHAVVDVVMEYLGSRLWAIRDHAARLIASQVEPGGEWNTVGKLITTDFRSLSENQFHGRLLCIRYILRHIWDYCGDESVLSNIEQLGVLLMECIPGFTMHSLSLNNTGAIGDIITDALAAQLAAKCYSQKLGECSKVLFDQFEMARGYGPRFLYGRGAALNLVYQLLIDKGPHDDNLPNSWTDVTIMFEDFDRAKYVLDNLLEQCIHIRAPVLIPLLGNIILHEVPDDVLALAMLTLTSMIEKDESKQSPKLLSGLQDKIRPEVPPSRELWNACIRLEAHIIRSLLSENADGTCFDLSYAHSWVLALQTAAKDELDFPTRMNAAESVLVVVPFLSNEQALASDLHCLDLLLVLYDLSNDDDEDVRAIAAHAASNLLQATGRHGCSKHLRPCALAAREQVLELICWRFGSERALAFVAVMRVIEVKHVVGSRTDSLKESCMKDSISIRLSKITDTANDLFAEEKQNLYVDELREIDAWSSVLGKVGPRMLEDQDMSSLHAWIQEGLTCLIRLLRPQYDVSQTRQLENGTEMSLGRYTLVTGSPFGTTYHPDILVIFVEVLTMARLLMRELSTSTHATQLHTLREQVTDLRAACNSVGAHELVFTSIEAVLHSQ